MLPEGRREECGCYRRDAGRNAGATGGTRAGTRVLREERGEECGCLGTLRGQEFFQLGQRLIGVADQRNDGNGQQAHTS